MILPELVTAARLELDDVDDGLDSRDLLWSDNELIRWANEAQYEAARRAYLIYDDSTPETQITTNLTDSIYHVSNRIIRLLGAKTIGGSKPFIKPENKMRLDKRDPKWGTRKGEPQRYVNFSNVIKFDRIPIVAGIIQLEAYLLPRELILGNQETIDIDVQHHEALLFWIKHRAFEKQDTQTNDIEQSAINSNKFTSRFGKRKSAAEEEVLRVEQPRRIRGNFF